MTKGGDAAGFGAGAGVPNSRAKSATGGSRGGSAIRGGARGGGATAVRSASVHGWYGGGGGGGRGGPTIVRDTLVCSRSVPQLVQNVDSSTLCAPQVGQSLMAPS